MGGNYGVDYGGEVVMELRPYQREVFELVTGGEGDMLIQAPTGAGKTIMFSKIIEALQARGQKCLVLAHRGELIKQAKDKLEKATGIECSVFSAYMKSKIIGSVTVASIQSLARLNDDFHFDVVIIDEAHRTAPPHKESQYADVLLPLKEGGARIIGFTATPYRLDSGAIYGASCWWQNLDYQIPLRQLIHEGYLCDYLHRVSMGTIKVSNRLKSVKKTAGDYNQKESSDLMVESQNLYSIVNTVQDEKHIVVFCVSIQHAEALGAIIKEPYSIVHSKMSSEDRDENLRSFDAGEKRWMLNVGVLTEGWDCTRVDCIVLARPTKSTALYVQMVGRGLRLHPEKEKCIIYDIVGAYREFGFVDDPNINENSQNRGEAVTKVCDHCLSVIPANSKECLECGAVFKEEVEVMVTDNEDDAHDMMEMDINEHPNFGEVYGGRAEWYTSSKGNECLMVKYFHNKRKHPIVHFYPKDAGWVGVKLAGIAKKHTNFFKENFLSTARYLKAVNGGHIFPMKNMMIFKDKSGYEKISSL